MIVRCHRKLSELRKEVTLEEWKDNTQHRPKESDRRGENKRKYIVAFWIFVQTEIQTGYVEDDPDGEKRKHKQVVEDIFENPESDENY